MASGHLEVEVACAMRIESASRSLHYLRCRTRVAFVTLPQSCGTTMVYTSVCKAERKMYHSARVTCDGSHAVTRWHTEVTRTGASVRGRVV